MKVQLLTLSLRILAVMPDRLRLALAGLLGRWLGQGENRRKRKARHSIQVSLPQLSDRQQQQLAQQHLQQRALSMLEIGMLWYGDPQKVCARITDIQGWEHLETAHTFGKGVIVAAPHFGAWELVGLYLSQQLDNTAILYKPPANPALQKLLNQRRARAGARSVAAGTGAIRQLLGVLKQGGYIGILPDQKPRQGNGELSELFGQQVMTMTLLVRLVQSTGARVIFAGCERLPDNRQYRLRIIPADEAIYSMQQPEALRAMNQGIEQVAGWNLAQYQWSYARLNRVQ